MCHDQVLHTTDDTSTPESGSTHPTILVVDDEQSILDLVRDILEMEGYTVLLASDGHAGFARAQEAQPDLVLTDIMMPIMDGHALWRQLRASPRTAQIPVIAMTAASFAPNGTAFDGLLPKPFELDALLTLIQALLGPPP